MAGKILRQDARTSQSDRRGLRRGRRPLRGRDDRLPLQHEPTGEGLHRLWHGEATRRGEQLNIVSNSPKLASQWRSPQCFGESSTLHPSVTGSRRPAVRCPTRALPVLPWTAVWAPLWGSMVRWWTTFSLWSSSRTRREVVSASADKNRELFWGVQGAGANFGVATSFTYQMHPLAGVTGACSFTRG